MSRSVEVKLDLSIALPLIDTIREHAVELNESYAGRVEQSLRNRLPISAHEAGRSRQSLSEVRAVLELFHPDFLNTARITISESEAPVILRACSFLRLRLREDKLSRIPDATLEAELDPNQYVGEDHRIVMCYLFLATLQQLIMDNLAPRPSGGRPLMELIIKVQGFFRSGRKVEPGQSALRVPPAVDSWQVVLLNDPVSLMAYVTTVLQRELDLPVEAAQRHMREVHESKSSVVWEGPREQAEAKVLALQFWHLTAITRPCVPA